MRRFIDQYEYIVSRYPDREAFVDIRERIDYKGFDRRASQIYAYLKKQGIAKEDIVMILLPRGINLYAAEIGVMKSGAAFIALEDTYPVNRIAYIKEDVSPKMVLDEKLMSEIFRNEEPLAGHEETDVHDALLAVYTSGSTGNPKGILHEYGLADALIEPGFYEYEEIGGITSPIYFIANFIFSISFMAKAITIHIIDEAMVRDFDRLKAYILKEKLNLIYLPPSYIRLYTEPSPSLRVITTGSEPANGLYYPGGKPAIFNVYSMSEAGFYVLQMTLDRKYDVAPVGRPSLPGLKYVIVDEEGKVIEGEGQGELCMENPFSRGYIHLPEKTREVFVDGLYHTRDIARRDGNGLYYIIGRSDDMIKIAGNRIEPAEIEARIQDITGLRKVVAKGFDTGDRAFICVYFIREEAKRLGILEKNGLTVDHEMLRTLLPEYMIPSYYVPVEEFPLTASKKIAKKELKMPEVSDYLTDYEPPEGETERYLCELFARVLGLDRVGRKDDFFLLGGDSMKSIQCVSQSARYEFSVKELREARTCEKLAAVCRKKAPKDPGRNRMEEGRREENISGAPFTSLFEANVTTDRTYTLGHETDRQLLQEAWNRALLKYPFFRQRLMLDQGKLYYVWREADTRIPDIGEDVGRIDRPMVFAGGSRVSVKTPHAYTDGFGMMVFEYTLLAEYLALRSGHAPEIEDAGYIEEQYYEMLSADYSDYGKAVPELYKTERPEFHFCPEGGEKGGRYLYDCSVSLPSLERLCERLFPGREEEDFSAIGGLLSVVVANVIAQAIRQVHPDLTLPIACRCPVNLRKILGHEGSLKNMSLCQATFEVSGTEAQEGLVRSLAGAKEALNPDVLKWQLFVIKALMSGKDPGKEHEQALFRMRGPAFLLSCMVNRTQADDEIRNFDSDNDTDIPLAVYITNFGENVRIRFIQQFEDDRYFSAFCALCEEQE